MIGPARETYVRQFESEVSIQCDRTVWELQREKSREAYAGMFHPLRISNQTRTLF